jgi:hypothetical protein
MKKSRSTALLKALANAGAFFVLVMAGIPSANSRSSALEPRTIVVTLLGGANREARGDVEMLFNANDLTGITFKRGKIRHRGFAIVDRTQMGVACEPKDAEYGSVKLKDGSWIAVAVCPENPSTTAIAIPSLIRARAAANEATAEMICWENKELRMGLCFKASSNPAAGPMPRTREHILLARQVG